MWSAAVPAPSGPFVSSVARLRRRLLPSLQVRLPVVVIAGATEPARSVADSPLRRCLLQPDKTRRKRGAETKAGPAGRHRPAKRRRPAPGLRIPMVPPGPLRSIVRWAYHRYTTRPGGRTPARRPPCHHSGTTPPERYIISRPDNKGQSPEAWFWRSAGSLLSVPQRGVKEAR